MATISLADFQVLVPGAIKLNKTQTEETIKFVLPSDIALNQVAILQTKITVGEDKSIFLVKCGSTPIWQMRADKGPTRGLWQTFMAKDTFGEPEDGVVSFTFSVPAGKITFTDIVIWYQRNVSI